ncbi:hypothetical protein DVH05_014632 [Phytophthora capsici]|nr:hypothetical protein DVH05_014632 [Phytophthora capsici]
MGKIHLTRDDYRILVNWSEDESHFELIYGTRKKTSVDGLSNTTKLDGFKRMAEYLNLNTSTRGLHLSGDKMQQRWRTFISSKFKPTLKKSITETGLGLTKKELESGMSVEDKLEKLCPQFKRMKAIFGEKPNIQASSTVALGMTPLNPSAGANAAVSTSSSNTSGGCDTNLDGAGGSGTLFDNDDMADTCLDNMDVDVSSEEHMNEDEEADQDDSQPYQADFGFEPSPSSGDWAIDEDPLPPNTVMDILNACRDLESSSPARVATVSSHVAVSVSPICVQVLQHSTGSERHNGTPIRLFSPRHTSSLSTTTTTVSGSRAFALPTRSPSPPQAPQIVAKQPCSTTAKRKQQNNKPRSNHKDKNKQQGRICVGD